MTFTDGWLHWWHAFNPDWGYWYWLGLFSAGAVFDLICIMLTGVVKLAWRGLTEGCDE